jgi:endonuclease YncB( thermonuclease family)
MINFQDGNKKSLIMLAQIGAQGILPKPNNLPALGNYDGYISRVIDGDTVVVRIPDNGELVCRLAYIDAPELDQPWGLEARDMLVEMSGYDVEVNILNYDKYHRAICDIVNPFGSLSLMVLNAGFAWIYKRANFPGSYLSAFGMAISDKQGMWVSNDNIDPYLWRRGTRS